MFLLGCASLNPTYINQNYQIEKTYFSETVLAYSQDKPHNYRYMFLLGCVSLNPTYINQNYRIGKNLL